MVSFAPWVLLPLVQHCGALGGTEALPPCCTTCFANLSVTDEVLFSGVALVWWFDGWMISPVYDLVDGGGWRRSGAEAGIALALGEPGDLVKEDADGALGVEQDVVGLVQRGRPRPVEGGRGSGTIKSRRQPPRSSRSRLMGGSPDGPARALCGVPLDSSWLTRARQCGERFASLVHAAPGAYRAQLESRFVGGVVLRFRRCLRRALMMGEALAAGRATIVLPPRPTAASSSAFDGMDGARMANVSDSSSFVASVVNMHLGMLDDAANRAGGIAPQASSWPSTEYQLHDLVPELRQVVTYGLRLGKDDSDADDLDFELEESSPIVDDLPDAGAGAPDAVETESALAEASVESSACAEGEDGAAGAAGADDGDGSLLVQMGPVLPSASGAAPSGSSTGGASALPGSSLSPPALDTSAVGEDGPFELVPNVLPSISHASVLDGVDDTLHHLWSTGKTATLEWLTAGLLKVSNVVSVASFGGGCPASLGPIACRREERVFRLRRFGRTGLRRPWLTWTLWRPGSGTGGWATTGLTLAFSSSTSMPLMATMSWMRILLMMPVDRLKVESRMSRP